VFMMVRHKQIGFAPGAFVFPGGALERDDDEIARDVSLSAATPELDEGMRAFGVAALRETFEESGVLLARARDGALVDAACAKALAPRLREIRFAEVLAAEGLTLALDLLVPFAHWITPKNMPKRFDTHFFIAALPSGQSASHDGVENVDSAWINPARALKASEEGRYEIILPTRLNLALLAEHKLVAEALEATKLRSIVTVLPEAIETVEGYKLRIPLEAGYGREWFSP
jgi:8-oxo-dGTP pyrophosphatase MutT (NUDIX family)